MDMITKQQKIILFRKFGLSEAEVIGDHTITYIQRRLSPDLWKEYLSELLNIMLSKMEKYSDTINKLNIQQANAFLLLSATPEDKFEALSKSLELWEY